MSRKRGRHGSLYASGDEEHDGCTPTFEEQMTSGLRGKNRIGAALGLPARYSQLIRGSQYRIGSVIFAGTSLDLFLTALPWWLGQQRGARQHNWDLPLDGQPFGAGAYWPTPGLSSSGLLHQYRRHNYLYKSGLNVLVTEVIHDVTVLEKKKDVRLGYAG